MIAQGSGGRRGPMAARPAPPRRAPANREFDAPPANARLVALDVLDRTLGRGQAAEEALERHPMARALTRRDRAFARLLIASVLRRLGELDAAAGAFLDHPPRALRVRNLLRLGAAQLLLLRTPPHAAVHETVRLATGELAGSRAMLNAILRRIAAAGPPAGPDPGPVNTPAWLLASWTAAYGASAANAIARAHLAEPPLDLMVRGDAAAFAAEVGGVALLDQLVRRPVGGVVEELPGYADGAFWVQDLAATLPARLLAPPPGAPVLDLCAAPGGKTLQLAAMGARVTAVDSSAERLRIVLANLERTRLAAELIVADVRSFAPAAPFPYVLLDAPCTATGTIRRHPDIQHLKQPGDVARLAALQAELMAAAARLVAPGGRLVYAVCSLQPEEGPAVIDAFLAATAGLAPEPIDRAELGGLAVAIDAAGRVRTLPCDLAEHGGMDGFFIARLRRRG